MSEVEEEVRDGYKEVRLGPKTVEIPEQWDISLIKEVADVKYGKSLPDEGEIPAVGSSGVFDYVCEELIRETTLVVGRKGSAGEVYLLKEPCWPSDTTFYLDGFDHSRIHIGFLYYFMNQFSLAKELEQTTIPSLDRSRLETYRIPTPSLPEQRRIADILSTVDEQIRQTDEIIERTEELRRGLMTEFFHSGYYQHSTIERPQFGQVPENWDICELSEVADIEMGSSPKSKYYNEEGDGLPFYQANNEFGYRNPSHDRWCSKPNKTADEGDTLVTIRGTYVGQVNVATEQCCIGRGLAAISAEKVDQEYLYHHLAHRERYVKSIASGSTFDSINSTELETLSVLVPPREEQEKIASCLKKLQEKYMAERRHKETLQELKHGLMQDLLTGKVRVDDLDFSGE